MIGGGPLVLALAAFGLRQRAPAPLTQIWFDVIDFPGRMQDADPFQLGEGQAEGDAQILEDAVEDLPPNQQQQHAERGGEQVSNPGMSGPAEGQDGDAMAREMTPSESGEGKSSSCYSCTHHRDFQRQKSRLQCTLYVSLIWRARSKDLRVLGTWWWFVCIRYECLDTQFHYRGPVNTGSSDCK